MLAAKHPFGKLAQWSQTLAEVDVEIQYRPGRKHSNADALSKAPVHLHEESVAAFEATPTANDSESHTAAADSLNSKLEMAQLQHADANLQSIFAT